MESLKNSGPNFSGLTRYHFRSVKNCENYTLQTLLLRRSLVFVSRERNETNEESPFGPYCETLLPVVLRTALSLRSPTVSKTEGKVFPNADLLAIYVYIYIYIYIYLS